MDLIFIGKAEIWLFDFNISSAQVPVHRVWHKNPGATSNLTSQHRSVRPGVLGEGWRCLQYVQVPWIELRPLYMARLCITITGFLCCCKSRELIPLECTHSILLKAAQKGENPSFLFLHIQPSWTFGLLRQGFCVLTIHSI